MKNKKISIKNIIIIVLIGIIIALILINLDNKNSNIEKTETSKEQLETTSDNTYVSMSKHLLEVNEKEEKLLSFKTQIANYIKSKNVNNFETTGDASVYINSFEEVLSIATKVTESEAATADNISEGKKAWVNGKLVTGNGADVENAYNNGYAKGYTEGQNSTGTIEYTYHTHGDGHCNETPIYHTHSAQNTAPCYTRCSGVGSYYIDGTGMYFCYKCGRSLSNSYYSGQCAYYNLTCTKTIDSYYCSLDSNTIISATIKFEQ